MDDAKGTVETGHEGAKGQLLAALREATAPYHQRLDLGLGGLLQRPTREAYASFLRGSYAILAPLELGLARLPTWSSVVPDAAQRVKSDWLVDDLRALGEAPPTVTGPSPLVHSLAAGLGCSYVMEGSTLGGAYLERTLAPALDLTPTHGIRYLHAYGTERGARWKAFLASLERAEATLSTDERRTVLDAAVDAFLAFEESYRREGLVS